MRKILKEKKGFTVTEVIFVAAISLMVIAAILSVWVFTYKTWAGENERTNLRIDVIKALETIKNDLRLSSLTYISFYPQDTEPYTAVSIPVADRDVNGLFTLDNSGKIDWDKTIIYHLVSTGGSKYTLRRTVFDPRDNTMNDTQRYSQMANVVSAGTGGGGSSTDMDFLENVDVFTISSLAPVIDFYCDSSTEVKENQVVFGWARLTPGDHTIRLEVTGKNSLSSGYNLGVDNLRIEPSGSVREMEYYNSAYAPGGAFTVSGGTATRIHDYLWNNDNYLKFSAGGTGSYIEINDYYDLWRESAFNNAALNNTERIEEETHVGLDIPEDSEEGEITWFSDASTGDALQDGADGYANPLDPTSAPVVPYVIRIFIDHSYLDIDPDEISDKVDLIRVKFKTTLAGTLRIERAYITRRSNGAAAAVYDGDINETTGGKTIEEYHKHQELFFKDNTLDFDGDGSTTDIVKGITISPAVSSTGEVWSEWTAFPLVVRDAANSDVDYFITLYISNIAEADCKYWQSSSAVQSYYLSGNDYNSAQLFNAVGTPSWSTAYPLVNSSNDVFIIANIDTWRKTGSVESQVFDTTLTSPAYNQIQWSENRPSKTDIKFKARSSGSAYMTGALDWDVISASGSNPGSLSIGSGRYVQFLGELSAEPYWQCSASSYGYDEYITDQISHPLQPYDFPEISGDPYVTVMSSPWVDDVQIDWPGADRICTLTADIAKKDDFGQAKVTVDGSDLVKVLSVHVTVSKDIDGRSIEEDNYIEVEPRNTGK
ncbi:MAG: hypothetical protein ABIH09_02190 [Candidatus Omnitrophota bacterium]